LQNGNFTGFVHPHGTSARIPELTICICYGPQPTLIWGAQAPFERETHKTPCKYTSPPNIAPVKIYIDESGDLGFTERSSPYFVIAALIVHDPLAIRRCFAKVRRNKLKKKYRELPEFKFNNSGPEIKKRILSCIASADVDIAYCVLRKEQVYLHLRSNHQIVYNYLTGSLISHIVQRFHDGGRVEITVDKSLNGIQREVFDQYLVYKTFEKNQGNDLAEISIEIEHADSKNEPCIQAADFIAGALHYYYRTDDDMFSGIINNKITLAFDYFKGPQK